MRVADRILAIVIGILSVFCFVEAFRVWTGWDGSGLMLLIVGVILLSLMLYFVVYPSHDATPVKWFSKKEFIHIGFLSGAFALYTSLMEYLGYLFATWIFLAVVSKYIGPGRRTWLLLIWTGVVAVGTFIVFKK